MKNIRVEDVLSSKSVYFREDVDKIKNSIRSEKGEVCLNFDNIENISPSSAHELLVLVKSFENVKFSNVSAKVLRIIKSLVKLRIIRINLEDYFPQQNCQALARNHICR